MKDTNDAPEFRRVLGPWSAGAIAAGSMIGTGIFFFVSEVAKLLPDQRAIMGAWAAGGLIALAGALSLAELAAAYPRAGGIYVYLRLAYGPFVAFLYAWSKFLIMRVGSFAIPALACAAFALDLAGIEKEAADSLKLPLGLGIIAGLTAVNIIGVRAGSRVQNVLTALKLAALFAMVCVGVAFVMGRIGPNPIVLGPPELSSGGLLLRLGGAMIAIMWVYGGWDESSFVAEEIQRPERNLPLSILVSVFVVGGLYLAVNYSYLSILTPAEVAATGNNTAPLAMERALGAGARKIMDLVLMLSTLGAANGMILTNARIAYAAGREQAFFRWFAHTHPATKTPVRGLVFQMALSWVDVLYLKDPNVLMYYTAASYWLFAGLTAIAVIVMRRRDPDRERPFRAWGYPVTPILFLLAALGMLSSSIGKYPKEARNTACILIAGAGLYLIQRSLSRGKGA